MAAWLPHRAPRAGGDVPRSPRAIGETRRLLAAQLLAGLVHAVFLGALVLPSLLRGCAPLPLPREPSATSESLPPNSPRRPAPGGAGVVRQSLSVHLVPV